MSQSQNSRIAPLPDDAARKLINKYYHHGGMIRYGNELPVQHRQTGIVIGCGEKFVPRGGFNHKLAGRYIDFTKRLIVPSDGSKSFLVDVSPMEYAPWDVSEVDGWRDVEEVTQLANIFIKIADLPETPFWEGDTVEILDYYAKRGNENYSNRWVIHGIDYDFLDRGEIYCSASNLRNDGKLDVSVDTKLPINLFSLLARGNLWKMEHGKPMNFASIENEAKFYQSLGMSKKITRHPPIAGARGAEYVGTYTTEEWDFTSAIGEIRSGAGDQMKLKNGKSVTFVLVKYDNEEFGRRMRAHTLAKFGLE